MDEYEEEYLSEGSEEEFGEVYDENDQEFLEHLMELRQQHARKLSQLEESYYNRQSDFGSGDLSNHGWEGSPSASTVCLDSRNHSNFLRTRTAILAVHLLALTVLRLRFTEIKK